MSKYHQNVEEIPSIGRQLLPTNTPNYEVFCRMLRPGERLVGVFDRLRYKCAPVIKDQDDFDNFYGSYRRGLFVSADYYAVPEDKLELP